MGSQNYQEYILGLPWGYTAYLRNEFAGEAVNMAGKLVELPDRRDELGAGVAGAVPVRPDSRFREVQEGCGVLETEVAGLG